MVFFRLEGSTLANAAAAETRTLTSLSSKVAVKASKVSLGSLSMRLSENAAVRRTILLVSLSAAINAGIAAFPIPLNAIAALLRIISFSLFNALPKTGTAMLAAGPICPNDFTALTLTSQFTSSTASIKKGTAALALPPMLPSADVAFNRTVQSPSPSAVINAGTDSPAFLPIRPKAKAALRRTYRDSSLRESISNGIAICAL